MAEPNYVSAFSEGYDQHAWEWFVTFGLRYATELHPSGLSWPHPKGWLVVEARDEETARALTHALVGRQWAGIYSQQPSLESYPWGELHRIAQVVRT